MTTQWYFSHKCYWERRSFHRDRPKISLIQAVKQSVVWPVLWKWELFVYKRTNNIRLYVICGSLHVPLSFPQIKIWKVSCLHLYSAPPVIHSHFSVQLQVFVNLFKPHFCRCRWIGFDLNHRRQTQDLLAKSWNLYSWSSHKLNFNITVVCLNIVSSVKSNQLSFEYDQIKSM